MGEYFAFTDDIRKSGHLLGGEALQPTQAATTVRVRNGKVSTTDGPFAETKEQLGGFYLVEARDLNDAIQVAARIPAARIGSIEVRPIDGPHAACSRRRADDRRERGRARRDARAAVDAIYRADSRRVLATLIRLLGDFDLAEEALHDAFAAAVERWPHEASRQTRGPGSSRRVASSRSTGCAAARSSMRAGGDGRAARAATCGRSRSVDDEAVEDDRLRLIFTCCHPALARRCADRADAARGLRPDDGGDRARLPPTPPTLAQRIVRAKAKIRDARIPYQVPRAPDLPERLDTVLHVVYLVFNEGYSASSGDVADAHDLSARSHPAGATAGGAAAGAGRRRGCSR